MQSPRDNFWETVYGGKPDRFINQYEGCTLLMTDPLRRMDKRIRRQDTIDPWDVTIRWKADDFSGTPYITDETKVCPDIYEWRDTVCPLR